MNKIRWSLPFLLLGLVVPLGACGKKNKALALGSCEGKVSGAFSKSFDSSGEVALSGKGFAATCGKEGAKIGFSMMGGAEASAKTYKVGGEPGQVDVELDFESKVGGDGRGLNPSGGTVTITRLDKDRLTGTFDVEGAFGDEDGAPKVRITGSFDYPAVALDKDGDDDEAEKKDDEDGVDDDKVDDKAAEGAPSREECEKALAHAIDLMLSDPQMTEEMRTAVKQQFATEEGKKSAEDAVAKCRKATDRKEVTCMLAATDLDGLSKCSPQGDAP